MEIPNHNVSNPFDNSNTTGGLSALKTVANSTANKEVIEDKTNKDSVIQTLINKNKKKKRTSVSMTQNAFEKIVTLAMSNDISVSSVVELILEEAVKDVVIKEHLIREFNKKEKEKKEKIQASKLSKEK